MPAATRIGVCLLAAGVATVGVAYAGAMVVGAAPEWAPVLMVLGASATSVAFFVLGAATRGVMTSRLAAVLATLFVVLVASFGVALLAGPHGGSGGSEEALLLGLPLRLGVVFFGVGVAPLVALPLVYAFTFAGRPEAGVAGATREAGQGDGGLARGGQGSG